MHSLSIFDLFLNFKIRYLLTLKKIDFSPDRYHQDLNKKITLSSAEVTEKMATVDLLFYVWNAG